MNRPVGSIEAQREYLDAHVRAINAYTQKRLDFIRYFRSGATHLDSLYFLRGQTDTEQYLETFYYELDPQFSTNADFKVAKILANDMLSVYLMGELESLESTNLRNMVLPLSDVRPTWQDSKTDLTELIYLLDSKALFRQCATHATCQLHFQRFQRTPRHEPFEDILRYENPKQPDTVA